MTDDDEERTEVRKVYAVTAGEYSDYRVLCAFEFEEDAREAVCGDDWVELRVYGKGQQPVKTITEWRVHAYLHDESPPRFDGPYSWSDVHWDFDGEPKFGPDRPVVNVEWFPGSSYRPPAAGRWGVFARCRDYDLALKAVHDRVAAIKARREGVA